MSQKKQWGNGERRDGETPAQRIARETEAKRRFEALFPEPKQEPVPSPVQWSAELVDALKQVKARLAPFRGAYSGDFNVPDAYVTSSPQLIRLMDARGRAMEALNAVTIEAIARGEHFRFDAPEPEGKTGSIRMDEASFAFLEKVTAEKAQSVFRGNSPAGYAAPR